MYLLKSSFIISTLLLCAMYTQGFAFSIGPFDFGGDAYFQEAQPQQVQSVPARFSIGKSLCYAISQQKKVETVVRQVEQVNSKEMKITIKKITLEPYVFGLNQDRQYVLRAKVVDEKVLKEVTVKNFDEEKTDQKDDAAEQPKNVAAIPAKGDIGELNIRQIRNVHVIEDSHFDVPKDYDKIFKETMAQVFCHVNLPAEK